jgi:hypothetical protein
MACFRSLRWDQGDITLISILSQNTKGAGASCTEVIDASQQASALSTEGFLLVSCPFAVAKQQ